MKKISQILVAVILVITLLKSVVYGAKMIYPVKYTDYIERYSKEYPLQVLSVK